MSKFDSKNSRITINAMRMLGVDMIHKANSGHPGIVLGAAPIMYALFRNHINLSPKNPLFPNRDRFILSAGHGSALLYSTMFLAGYKGLDLKDLENFRQIDSVTPGHPEKHILKGVEISTGPLGQGVATSVGVAIGETFLNKSFKCEYGSLYDNYTYCLFGDGCLQEGIFDESISIAGNYKLNKLILLYDSNDIQLDGKVADTTNIDTKKYFESKNFNYILVKNGHDHIAISEAIEQAKKSKDKPTVIEIKTKIGFGSAKENSNAAHGSPLSEKEIKDLRVKLNYNNEAFEIPKAALEDFEPLKIRGEKAIEKYNKIYEYFKKDKKFFKKLKNCQDGIFHIDEKDFDGIKDEKQLATRNLCGEVLNIVANNNPFLIIGNSDLSSSTKVKYQNGEQYSCKNRLGRNINYGVREFASNAINTGISSYNELKAIGSTFLAFSDYNKAAIRLAAISEIPLISIYSHDSITVGEDGPTHQPVEQTWTLRLIPNNFVFRPCNKAEMIAAFKFALESKKYPTSIITSRSNFIQTKGSVEKALKGAYLIKENDKYKLTIIATGSEMEVALKVSEILEKEHMMYTNVVSMPCDRLFDQQSKAYKESILGDKKVVSIEFGVTTPWYKYADITIGIDRYGYSGKPNDVIKKLGLDPIDIAKNIMKKYKEL
ncbi:MAG: transketolase [Mycoplasmoidaceae bacterium]